MSEQNKTDWPKRANAQAKLLEQTLMRGLRSDDTRTV